MTPSEQSGSLVTDAMVEKAVRTYHEVPLPSEMPVEQETREAMRAALEAVTGDIIETLRVPELLDAMDWYRRCLEDVQDGRVVRGLGEAKAGYDAAHNQLRRYARCHS